MDHSSRPVGAKAEAIAGASTSLALAWRNVSHDRARFAVTLLGIAFALFLMTFQGSLLAGFLRAASRVIDATDAELWITARGVPCFDFATPLPERFRALALGVAGVGRVRRVAAGFASWLKPAGARQTVILVGADTGVGPAFPTPRLRPSDALVPEAVLVDRSNQEALRVNALPSTVEIGSRRAQVLGAIDGFSSFVGTPYVFTSYREAHRYLGLRSEDTVFLLVKLVPDRDLREVARGLRVRLPDADVWTRQEFSWRAQTYWLTQTGAGGAILTAAVLGFLVGLVVVSQNIYATTLESLDEFATLKAMGATRGYVQRLVLFQALLSGVLGSALGLLATFPLVAAIASGIPWIYTPIWLPPAMMAVSLLMCGLASIASVRKAVSVEPARVFRA